MQQRSDLDLQAMRHALEDERATLRHTSAASAGEREPVRLEDQAMGRLSRMDAMQVQAMAKALEMRRQTRLSRITAALRRLDDDAFGECEECGLDIPAGRLAADATVERCVNCAV